MEFDDGIIRCGLTLKRRCFECSAFNAFPFLVDLLCDAFKLFLLFRGDFDLDFTLDLLLEDVVQGLPSLSLDGDPFGELAGGSLADFDR